MRVAEFAGVVFVACGNWRACGLNGGHAPAWWLGCLLRPSPCHTCGVYLRCLWVLQASTYWWMARSWLAHDPLPSVPFPSPDFVSAAGAAVLCWLASIVVALYDPVFGHRDAIMRRRTAAHWMLVVQRGFQVGRGLALCARCSPVQSTP